MMRRSQILMATLGCAGHCFVTFTRIDHSGSGTDGIGPIAPVCGVSRPLVCCDVVNDSIAALSSALRSICKYEADADIIGTKALGVEVDDGTDVLKVEAGFAGRGLEYGAVRLTSSAARQMYR